MYLLVFKYHRGEDRISIDDWTMENNTHLQLPCSSNIPLHILIAVETCTDGHGVAITSGRETGIVGDFKIVVFTSENTDL